MGYPPCRGLFDPAEMPTRDCFRKLFFPGVGWRQGMVNKTFGIDKDTYNVIMWT